MFHVYSSPSITSSCSKQRHNKLWRSHSDSDLSDHHEPLSKSCAQPLSLGRSDPHNTASNKPGPSVKELLESLGTLATTGKPALANQHTPPAVKSKQRNSSSPGGVAAPSADSEAPSLDVPSCSATVQITQFDSPCAESTADSVPSSLTNGLCDCEEQSSLLPATAAPKLQTTDAMTVAQGVLEGQTHLPTFFHHVPLSPAPSPTPACKNEVSKPQTYSLPVLKPMLLSVPKPTTTQIQSTQQAAAQCLSAPVPVSKPACDQQMCGLSSNGLAAQPSSTSDFIRYPSAIPQDNEVLLGHAADHINFFSAREKFKGMSQDGKSCQLRSCVKDQQPMRQEVLANETTEVEERKVQLLIWVSRAFQIVEV